MVTKLADKAFSPEGAMELTAQLSAVGGAFGAMNDPLKLMYMTTNDMNGLQDALAGTVKGLATFNQALLSSPLTPLTSCPIQNERVI